MAAHASTGPAGWRGVLAGHRAPRGAARPPRRRSGGAEGRLAEPLGDLGVVRREGEGLAQQRRARRPGDPPPAPSARAGRPPRPPGPAGGRGPSRASGPARGAGAPDRGPGRRRRRSRSAGPAPRWSAGLGRSSSRSIASPRTCGALARPAIGSSSASSAISASSRLSRADQAEAATDRSRARVTKPEASREKSERCAVVQRSRSRTRRSETVLPEPTARSVATSSGVKSTRRVGGLASQTLASSGRRVGTWRQPVRLGREVTTWSKKVEAAARLPSLKATPIRQGSCGLVQATMPVAWRLASASRLRATRETRVPRGWGRGATSWQPWGPRSTVVESKRSRPTTAPTGQETITRGTLRGFSTKSALAMAAMVRPTGAAGRVRRRRGGRAPARPGAAGGAGSAARTWNGPDGLAGARPSGPKGRRRGSVATPARR